MSDYRAFVYGSLALLNQFNAESSLVLRYF